MNYLVEKKDLIINELRGCLNNELYIGALSLALTIPDIFQSLENTTNRNNKKNYIKWLNTYFVCANKKYLEEDFEFLPDDLYALRCAILHNGQNSIEQQYAQKVVHRFNIQTSKGDEFVHLWGTKGLEQVEENELTNYSDDDLVSYRLQNSLGEEKEFSFHYKHKINFNIWAFCKEMKEALNYFVEVNKSNEEVISKAKNIFLFES